MPACRRRRQGRPVARQRRKALGSAYTSSYVYTHLGQLWQGPLNGAGTQEQYLYCNSGQPHQVTALAPLSSSPTCSSPGTTDYSSQYDAWDNMTTRTLSGSNSESDTLTYDSLDKLLRWNGTTSSSNKEAWYFYDAAGTRVMLRTASTGSGGNPATSAATIMTYAFGLEDHQYQYSGSGSTMTDSNDEYYYSLGGTLIGMLTGSGTLQTQFLLTDSLGSVVAAISNTAGSSQVLGNQLYGPYGNLRYNAGTIGTAKGFTGHYADALTGLDYYAARYYDPVIGRFLSPDTVEGNAQGADPYAYVGGNPETETDPTGEFRYNPVTGQASYPSIAPNVNSAVFTYNAPLAYLPAPPIFRPTKRPPTQPTVAPFIKKIVQVAKSLSNLVTPASLAQGAVGAFRNGAKNVWKYYMDIAKNDPLKASDTPLYDYLVKPLTGGTGKIAVAKRAKTLQEFMDGTENASKTIDMTGFGLSALGGILDGYYSGTTYYHNHPGQGVARAVLVGVVHGVFSAGGSIIGGMAGEAAGIVIGGSFGSVPLVTDEVTTPAGAIIGGIAGAVAGSYMGSVDGDVWASDIMGG